MNGILNAVKRLSASGTLYAHGNAKRPPVIDIFHNSIILEELW